MSSTAARQFVLQCTRRARGFLLREGTDVTFGARHLKRAIERHLVFPLSNLLATGQIELGDLIRVRPDPGISKLIFLKESGGALAASFGRISAGPPPGPAATVPTGVAKAVA